MDIEVFYNSRCDFGVKLDGHESKALASTNNTRLTYTPNYKNGHTLTIETKNPMVLKYPIEVTRIVFDNFWIVEKDKVKFGFNEYDESYVAYANKHHMTLDRSVTNNNIMFFTGRLVFKFSHPIYKFLDDTLR